MLKGHIVCCQEAVGPGRLNKDETGIDFGNQIVLWLYASIYYSLFLYPQGPAWFLQDMVRTHSVDDDREREDFLPTVEGSILFSW